MGPSTAQFPNIQEAAQHNKLTDKGREIWVENNRIQALCETHPL